MPPLSDRSGDAAPALLTHYLSEAIDILDARIGVR